MSPAVHDDSVPGNRHLPYKIESDFMYYKILLKGLLLNRECVFLIPYFVNDVGPRPGTRSQDTDDDIITMI